MFVKARRYKWHPLVDRYVLGGTLHIQAERYDKGGAESDVFQNEIASVVAGKRNFWCVAHLRGILRHL